MLQAWIANPDLGEVEVEEKYRVTASETRTDHYSTVPCYFTWTSMFHLAMCLRSFDNLYHSTLWSFRLPSCSLKNNMGSRVKPKTLLLHWSKVTWLCSKTDFQHLLWMEYIQHHLNWFDKVNMYNLINHLSSGAGFIPFTMLFSASGWLSKQYIRPGQKGVPHPQACPQSWFWCSVTTTAGSQAWAPIGAGTGQPKSKDVQGLQGGESRQCYRIFSGQHGSISELRWSRCLSNLWFIYWVLKWMQLIGIIWVSISSNPNLWNLVELLDCVVPRILLFGDVVTCWLEVAFSPYISLIVAMLFSINHNGLTTDNPDMFTVSYVTIW